MSAAPDPIRAALCEFLSSDSQLTSIATGVHHQEAPPGAEYPYMVFSRPTDIPVWSFREAHHSLLWLIKGICRGRDAAQAEAIDARCEALLNHASFEIAGFKLLGLQKESGMPDLSETDAGETIYQRGANYRLTVEPA